MAFWRRIREGIGRAIRKVADWISPPPPTPPEPPGIIFRPDEASAEEISQIEDVIRETRKLRFPETLPPPPPPSPASPPEPEPFRLPFREQEIAEPEIDSDLDAARESILRILAMAEKNLSRNPRFSSARVDSATYAKSGDFDAELVAMLAPGIATDPHELSEAQLDFELSLDTPERDALQALRTWISPGYRCDPSVDESIRYPRETEDDETGETIVTDASLAERLSRSGDVFTHYMRAENWGNALSQHRAFMETSAEHGRVVIEMVLRVYWHPSGRRPKQRS